MCVFPVWLDDDVILFHNPKDAGYLEMRHS